MAIRPADHGIFASAVAAAGGAGYISGGTVTDTPMANVDKFAFSNDVRTAITALAAGTYLCSAFGNSAVAGYVAGGSNPSVGPSTTVYKTSFVDDAQSTLSAVLSRTNNTQAGMSNSGVAGYTGGGEAGGAGANADIDKLTFSSEAMSTLGTGLTTGRRQLSAFANSGTAGYFAGGNQGASSPTYYATNIITKLAFPGDGISVLSATLSAITRQSTGFANSGTAGYIVLGRAAGTIVATVDKLTFSGESRSTLGTGLSAATAEASAMANSGTAGYVAIGGSYGTAVTTVDKFAFADDSRTTLGTGLATARMSSAGMANEGSLAP